jgi:hypothetical protein
MKKMIAAMAATVALTGLTAGCAALGITNPQPAPPPPPVQNPSQFFTSPNN